MKAIKYVVLAAAILGLVAFFLPLVEGEQQDWRASLTGFQVVKGVDNPSEVVQLKDRASQELSESAERAGLNDPGIAKFAQDANDLRPIIVIIFAPTVLLLLLAIAGIARGRFGRPPAVAVLLGSLASVVLGLTFLTASEGETIRAGAAAYLILVSGIVGAVAGVLGLVKPDTGSRFA